MRAAGEAQWGRGTPSPTFMGNGDGHGTTNVARWWPGGFFPSGRGTETPAGACPPKRASLVQMCLASILFLPLLSHLSWAAMVTSAGLTQPEETLFIFLLSVQNEQTLILPV